jgi:hypothetical protein
MTNTLDTKPRGVGLRIALPGRLMMRVIESPERPANRSALVKLYKGEAHVALYSAALAVHMLPRHVASKNTQYEAVLADIRDFLAFRFRLDLPGVVGIRRYKIDDISADATDWEYVDHVIKGLDHLSREMFDNGAKMTDVLRFMRELKDMLKIAARRIYPGDAEDYAEYETMLSKPQPRIGAGR